MGDFASILVPYCLGCRTFHHKHVECPDGTRWWAGWMVCGACGYRYTDVLPVRAEAPLQAAPLPRDQICLRCGKTTANAEAAI